MILLSTVNSLMTVSNVNFNPDTAENAVTSMPLTKRNFFDWKELIILL